MGTAGLHDLRAWHCMRKVSVSEHFANSLLAIGPFESN